MLHEDLRIRKFIKKKVGHAGISRIVIERRADKMSVNIHTARPGHPDRQARCRSRSVASRTLAALTSNEVFINIK